MRGMPEIMFCGILVCVMFSTRPVWSPFIRSRMLNGVPTVDSNNKHDTDIA